MDAYRKLTDLLNDRSKTQFMKQSADLCGLKYLKIYDLFLLHSYFERKDGRYLNPLFAAPAVISKIERINGLVEITIKSLKDEYDFEAVSLVRQISKDEAEVTYSHVLPDLLTPKLKKNQWDNWTFAYSLSPEEKLLKRIERNKTKMASVCRSFKASDFEGKSILFLGCGDGDEIQTFIDYFLLKRVRILGVEQSKAALKNCEAIKARFPNMVEFREVDLENIAACGKEKFDYIISLGIFDRETLEFDFGANVLKEVRNNLNFDYLINSAYTFELFTAENYYNLGFNVLQSCLPGTLYSKDYSFLYLLKDSGRKNSLIFDSIAKDSKLFYS